MISNFLLVKELRKSVTRDDKIMACVWIHSVISLLIFFAVYTQNGSLPWDHFIIISFGISQDMFLQLKFSVSKKPL